jgi:acyl carrier protein
VSTAVNGGPQSAGQEEIQRWVLDNCRGLGLKVEGPGSDFFSSGGTSLAAMRLIAAAEERFGEDALPPEDLYEHSSLREIAAVILKHGVPADASDA